MAVRDLCAGGASEETNPEFECAESKLTTRTAPGKGSDEELLEMCCKLAPNIEEDKLKKEERMIYDEESASDDYSQLLPGLPDEISKLVLDRLSLVYHPYLLGVSKGWRLYLKSDEFQDQRLQKNMSEACILVLAEKPNATPFRAYFPKADQWFSLPPTPGHSEDEIWEGFACVSVGSHLYVLGGTRRRADSPGSGEVVADVLRYDAKTNMWNKARSMKTPRSWFAASAVGECIFVAGGQNDGGFLRSAQVYDTVTDEWGCLPGLSCQRRMCQGVTLDGEFWVIGGEMVTHMHIDNSDDGPEVYNLDSRSWRREISPTAAVKVAGPLAVAEGKLLCVHQRKVWKYEKGERGWSVLGDVSDGDLNQRPYPRHNFGFVAIDNQIYIIGGIRQSWQYQTRCTIQKLSTVEVSTIQELQAAGFGNAVWRNASPMGISTGTILAAAVVWF